ncbi:two-component system response regulator CreB [Burkholderiaceae bacterium DAT-1]|nr:two-component system response regulator CreB [Burkholderiaceae bacterium DAT-1]
MSQRIILIEDEAAIADTIVYALRSEGFEVHWAMLGTDGLAHLQTRPADLVILDVGLPDISGFEVCKAIRRQSDVPVVFLTARSEEIDRIIGFELGADDYVLKPFSPRELVARVKAILRRGIQSVQTGSALRHDVARAKVFLGETPLDLTRYEYRLLITLLDAPERVFTRAQLMDHAWEEPEASFERTVDAHIKSLRAKLRQADPDNQYIHTHRGLGYSLRLA